MPHLLKKLELNGFKSFAQKTIFEFPNGITAVVGPNGSGKSNVIDAIRWLLGERDAKNLRGAKSEDLIFAGTAQRPRVGQAQASLHFDNINNFFPVEFSEIVVSRQVNRDGTNQYFLNKAEVRLKDIIDFFAQARLGARGLIVVTQGNSDMLIQASPIERREMIEEMLGLREYELKKADAERRLRHTKINLDKIRALIEEIAPHLRSLTRQTNRWEKRETFATELRELENNFFGSAFEELHQAGAEADKRIVAHAELRAELERERKSAESHLKEVETKQPKEREDLTEVKRATRELLDARNALQKEIGRLEAELAHAARSSGAGSAPAGALMGLLKKIKSELEAILSADPETMRSRIAHMVKEVAKAIGDPPSPDSFGEASPISDKLKKELDFIHKKLSDIERDMKELGAKEQALEQAQEGFYSAFKAAVARFEGAKEKIEKWEVAHREIEFEKERVTMRHDEWERQVRQAGREPSEFSSASVRVPSASVRAEGDAERRMLRLRGELASIGEVDEAIMKEAKETGSRYEFLKRESEDLDKAKEDLRKVIGDLQEKIRTEFSSSLLKINKEFQTFFELMFDGGHAKLRLSDNKEQMAKKKAKEKNEQEEGAYAEVHVKDEVEIDEDEEPAQGIEIEVKLPKKRIATLDALSGGERSLVGIAALFALISVSPPPFLVLDEVDAPLDERNAKRFAEMLKRFSEQTQFILVTHNRATMEAAHMLYGMTMNEDGTSKVVSLKLSEYAA